MTATPLTDLARRLVDNVDADRSEFADGLLRVPGSSYSDEDLFQRELEAVFRRSPLLVALSCDVREPGSFTTLTIADRPVLVVRGDDGVVRVFLNVCRHRGAQVANDDFGSCRRFTCPYHFWVFDTQGEQVGHTAREAFAGMDTTRLVELPSAERSGAVFAILTPGVELDIDAWLGDMASALAMLRLDDLYRHRDGLGADSGNWKASADGYVDGYHLGYLHRGSIGAKSITNRNTYDLYGPHVRVGFANKPIQQLREQPPETWNLRDGMSLVHYVFPNVSISGLPDERGIMLSRIHPGPTAATSTVYQYQYFRKPMVDDADRAEADTKREQYLAVTRDEDFATVLQVTRGAAALGDETFWYGRNEPGNQNLHRWVSALVEGSPAPTVPVHRPGI